MSTITPHQAQAAYDHAQQIYSRDEVEGALDDMAADITRQAGKTNPLFLAVMTGGLIPLGLLLPRLGFPLRVDYIHATRYRQRTYGTELEWKKEPETPLAGETVIIVDDILDEGHTLEAIIRHCKHAGAAAVLSAVLVEKQHQRGNGLRADFTGLLAPDRYLFGYGMDYKGYWRNAAGIFAINEKIPT